MNPFAISLLVIGRDCFMSRLINIQAFLNEHPFSRLQMGVFIFTFLITFFDGYDTAVIGYIAPSLLDEWQLEKGALAPVLSAALLGLAIGAIIFGPVADRFGRKRVLIIAVFIFSLGTTLSAFVTTLTQLEILRFITGLGLGAAMPNAVTLLSEFCPKHKRALIVNTMFCGFPLGAAMGGFIAAYLIPTFGWRSVLLFGGIIPLLLTVLMCFYLPESLRFLVKRKAVGDEAKAMKILAKIHPEISISTSVQLKLEDEVEVSTRQLNEDVERPEKRGLKLVLSREYYLGSGLLWVTYFMGLVIFYGVMNWMPTLFREASLSEGLASMVTGLFALGGLGAVANGWLMDRFNGTLLISLFYGLTAVSVALIGYLVSINIVLLISIVLFAGLVMNTAQASMPALAANFYPTAGRTTGVSMMLGVGRFGGIAGSYLVAFLIAADLSLTQLFVILAIPAIISAGCLIAKNRFNRINTI